ncbi:MAG TPA: DUF3606 domain-containing protein [Ramlibacter sp.]|jgi:hypothetical protein|uniref:DUF3606 domain-containing protein n=1 Tax=Ramlibacter sp. TaxID=1917967 RepID=UPI002D66CC6D|nr:DUF3606 domain-containing protein [Ramlibacter sp.]HZY20252.1 DUF3606 domain-containing protein [Ramlibacter sp.]
MSGSNGTSTGHKAERIDVTWEYALCAWARHFNTSEKHVKEAVAAVGDRADRVREHLASRRQPAGRSGERPSSC